MHAVKDDTSWPSDYRNDQNCPDRTAHFLISNSSFSNASSCSDFFAVRLLGQGDNKAGISIAPYLIFWENNPIEHHTNDDLLPKCYSFGNHCFHRFPSALLDLQIKNFFNFLAVIHNL